MFWHKEFWIITLIILLIVYILGKSKHLIQYKYPYTSKYECLEYLGLRLSFLWSSARASSQVKLITQVKLNIYFFTLLSKALFQIHSTNHRRLAGLQGSCCGLLLPRDAGGFWRRSLLLRVSGCFSRCE